MDHFPRIRMGIPRPQSAEDVEAQATLEGMRVAIRRGGRDSALIRSVLITAEKRGLSGEDTYTMLAYHSLMALEEGFQERLRIAEITPKPPWILASPPPATSNEVEK